MGSFNNYFRNVIPFQYQDTSSDVMKPEEEEGYSLPNDQPISNEVKQQVLGWKDPVEENAKIALESIQNGPHDVPVPESLKPPTLKTALKDALLGMIPGYGPVRAYQQSAKRQYDESLYNIQVKREQAEYALRKEAAMKWHDAQIKQTQEASTRQAKAKLMLMLFPNASGSMMLNAMGIKLPKSDQIKFETRKIQVYGPDGKSVSGWINAEYNPEMGSYTYTDPWSKQIVTPPKGALVANVQNIGAPSSAGVQRFESGGLLYNQDPSGNVTPVMFNGQQLTGKGESETGSPLDRQQFELEKKVEAGTATPEDVANLRAIKRTRLTVPGFTSNAATERSLTSQATSMKRSYLNSNIVKRYNWVADAANFSTKINPNSKNPADHQAIIYQFAKAMDPESVVREGEYNTVKRYSQSMMDALGLDIYRIYMNKGLLTPRAIKLMQQTIKDRYNSTKLEYKNFRSEMGRMLDDMSGEPGNEETLPDFSKAYPGLGSKYQVQKNKRTGAMRYSKDGGKTWINGEPPE